jgi:hypothetical protein
VSATKEHASMVHPTNTPSPSHQLPRPDPKPQDSNLTADYKDRCVQGGVHNR